MGNTHIGYDSIFGVWIHIKGRRKTIPTPTNTLHWNTCTELWQFISVWKEHEGCCLYQALVGTSSLRWWRRRYDLIALSASGGTFQAQAHNMGIQEAAQICKDWLVDQYVPCLSFAGMPLTFKVKPKPYCTVGLYLSLSLLLFWNAREGKIDRRWKLSRDPSTFVSNLFGKCNKRDT